MNKIEIYCVCVYKKGPLKSLRNETFCLLTLPYRLQATARGPLIPQPSKHYLLIVSMCSGFALRAVELTMGLWDTVQLGGEDIHTTNFCVQHESGFLPDARTTRKAQIKWQTFRFLAYPTSQTRFINSRLLVKQKLNCALKIFFVDVFVLLFFWTNFYLIYYPQNICNLPFFSYPVLSGWQTGQRSGVRKHATSHLGSSREIPSLY